jgi:hypothetical protein
MGTKEVARGEALIIDFSLYRYTPDAYVLYVLPVCTFYFLSLEIVEVEIYVLFYCNYS